jgi:hypothetical protein
MSINQSYMKSLIHRIVIHDPLSHALLDAFLQLPLQHASNPNIFSKISLQIKGTLTKDTPCYR